MPKFLKLSSGNITEEATVAASAGAGDAGKVPQLDGAGRLDNSMMPNGIGAESIVLPASENLSAGDFVNIWSDAGTAKVRKADATSISKKADGFVTSAVVSGANATVYYGNRNEALAGLTIGSQYFLSDAAPGGVIDAPPAGSGKIVQKLGRAYGAAALLVEIEDAIILV